MERLFLLISALLVEGRTPSAVRAEMNSPAVLRIRRHFGCRRDLLAWTPRLRSGQAHEGVRPSVVRLGMVRLGTRLFVYACAKLRQVFPEEFTGVYYAAAAHVK